jgi:hypothetical protein
MPDGWFGEDCQDLLARLCVVVVQLEDLGVRLREFRRNRNPDDNDYKNFKITSDAWAKLNKCATDLSGKMRLTPASRMRTENATTLIKHHQAASKMPFDM